MTILLSSKDEMAGNVNIIVHVGQSAADEIAPDTMSLPVGRRCELVKCQ
jgi:hypothetical protein